MRTKLSAKKRNDLELSLKINMHCMQTKLSIEIAALNMDQSKLIHKSINCVYDHRSLITDHSSIWNNEKTNVKGNKINQKST